MRVRHRLMTHPHFFINMIQVTQSNCYLICFFVSLPTFIFPCPRKNSCVGREKIPLVATFTSHSFSPAAIHIENLTHFS